MSRFLRSSQSKKFTHTHGCFRSVRTVGCGFPLGKQQITPSGKGKVKFHFLCMPGERIRRNDRICGHIFRVYTGIVCVCTCLCAQKEIHVLSVYMNMGVRIYLFNLKPRLKPHLSSKLPQLFFSHFHMSSSLIIKPFNISVRNGSDKQNPSCQPSKVDLSGYINFSSHKGIPREQGRAEQATLVNQLGLVLGMRPFSVWAGRVCGWIKLCETLLNYSRLFGL